jgi:gliding motility-associated-like protein
MPPRLFITRIIMACLFSFAGKTVFAQKIMLSTEGGELFVVDMSGNSCTPEKQGYADGWGIGTLGMFRSTYYYFSTVDAKLYGVSGNPANRVTIELAAGYIPTPGNITAMTVDKNGRLFWISDPFKGLRTYQPETSTGWTTGGVLFNPAGDMVFYKDKLFLSTDVGIVEVNIQNPPASQLIIPTTRVFPGLVNIVAACSGENKVYGVETVGTTTNIVEIDLDNKKILGTYCSFNLNGKVADAASPYETGEPSFIGINSVASKRPCFPDTAHEVKINAFTPAGDSGLTYTFRKGTETMGPFNKVGGSFAFNGQTTTGLWNLNIKSSSGCSRDTTVMIYPQGKITAVADVRPDTCGLGNGSVTLNITEGRPPFGFKFETLVPQASPVFSGLSQGNYKLQVIDSTNCSTDIPVTIGPYTPRTLISDIIITPATTCNPAGEIKIIYQSSIDAPTASLDNGSFQLKNIFSAVPAGTHRLQVKKGSCVFDTIIVMPLSTAMPVIDSTITHNPCVGNGNIKLVISGSEGPYRFEVGGKLYNSGTTTAILPAGTYPATIYSAAKCIVDSFRFTIRAKTDCDTIQAIFIPSAFTPNGDGKNDILKPLKNPKGNVVRFVFRVYNRVGQVLFESTSPNKGWDGKYKGNPQPAAVYVWVFQGTEADGKLVIYKGTTLLIR